jgi:hypothetical protein
VTVWSQLKMCNLGRSRPQFWGKGGATSSIFITVESSTLC